MTFSSHSVDWLPRSTNSPPSQRVGSGFDRGADPFGLPKSVLRCGIRQQACELFTSDPAERRGCIGPQLTGPKKEFTVRLNDRRRHNLKHRGGFHSSAESTESGRRDRTRIVRAVED